MKRVFLYIDMLGFDTMVKSKSSKVDKIFERIDVHLDKRKKTKINGKFQEVIIRVPLNSERNISVENARNGTL